MGMGDDMGAGRAGRGQRGQPEEQSNGMMHFSSFLIRKKSAAISAARRVLEKASQRLLITDH
jgi:hypothetical protein